MLRCDMENVRIVTRCKYLVSCQKYLVFRHNGQITGKRRGSELGARCKGFVSQAAYDWRAPARTASTRSGFPHLTGDFHVRD